MLKQQSKYLNAKKEKSFRISRDALTFSSCFNVAAR